MAGSTAKWVASLCLTSCNLNFNLTQTTQSQVSDLGEAAITRPMDPFTSSTEITELALDLPVYMLQRMPPAVLPVQNELIAFLDHRMSLPEDDDAHWDLRMGNALAVLACAGHPDALSMCVEMYHWVEDASPFLRHKVLRLVETALDPIEFFPQARKWMRTLRRGNDLHLALTILAVRSRQLDEGLEKTVLEYWGDDPLMGAKLMSLSRHESFFDLAENELARLVPFLRYFAVDDEAGPLFEHDLWAEMAEAWFAIAHAKRITPAWLDPELLTAGVDPQEIILRHREWQEHLDAFLLERFGARMPLSADEWLQKLGDSPEETLFKARFLEVKAQLEDTQTTQRRRLRLLKSPEA